MKLEQIAEAGIQLINEAGQQGTAALAKGMEWSNAHVYVRIIEQQRLVTAFLITEPRPFEQADINLVPLLNLLDADFDLSELQDLSFLLGVDYENLGGETKRGKARELLLSMQRHGRLPDLIASCAGLRPRAAWPAPSKQLPYIAKLEKAVVVDLTRPALREAASYLDICNIDAHIILFTNKIPYPEGETLLPTDGWEAVIRTFTQTMRYYPFKGLKTHYFLSALSLWRLVWGMSMVLSKRRKFIIIKVIHIALPLIQTAI
jgi:hypothetical protein